MYTTIGARDYEKSKFTYFNIYYFDLLLLELAVAMFLPKNKSHR